MKRALAACFAVSAVAVLLVASVAAQSGPEERALLEMATAKDMASVKRHLPEVVVEQLNKLPRGQRQEFEQLFFVPERLRARGLQIRVADGGRALAVAEWIGAEDNSTSDDRNAFEVRLEKKISNGLEALLELRTYEPGGDNSLGDVVQVWMRMEQGEWRVAEFDGQGAEVKLDEKLTERLKARKLDAQEASATNCMWRLISAQAAYAATYPHLGFAPTLEMLGGEGHNEFAAGLIDSALASGTSSGYRFTMQVDPAFPHTSYQIMARPVKYADGAKSFFTDQSGLIRVTTEDREPTREDPPLQ